MKVIAPAKINLFLEVISKRKDNYHNIFTVMQTVTLYDEITLKFNKKNNIEFKCDWSSVKIEKPPDITDNLAFKAAVLLKNFIKEKRGVSVFLKKRIPVSAGLGGGSSDACAVLMGLVKLLDVKISRRKILELLLQLGSDVPFFFYGGCCVCEGRGEKVQKIIPSWENKPLNIVLVYPGIEISSKEVYGGIKKITPVNRKYLNSVVEHIKSANKLNSILFNRLENVVFEKYPQIAQIKKLFLESASEFSLMSGSGSTVYGVFDDFKKAELARNIFKRKYPLTFLVRTTQNKK